MSGRMNSRARLLVGCCLTTIAALLLVGLVSHGFLRHIVQTSPLWIAVVLGARGSPLAKWAALPCFVFWAALMVVVWLYLLGWIHWISGTFSSTEVALTVVVAAATLVGIHEVTTIGSTGVRAAGAFGTSAAVACLQIIAFRLSLLPAIAHR